MAKKIVTQKGEISLPWQKFLKRLNEFKNKELNKWEVYDFAGYIIETINKQTKKPYVLTFNGPPASCEEIYLIRTSQVRLGNPSNLRYKEFLDWLIKGRLRNRKSWTTFAFLSEKACRDFNRKPDSGIDRTTPLPIGFKEMSEHFGVPLQTYGDLAFAKMELTHDPDPKYIELFENLLDAGLNEEDLEALL